MNVIDWLFVLFLGVFAGIIVGINISERINEKSIFNIRNIYQNINNILNEEVIWSYDEINKLRDELKELKSIIDKYKEA